MLATTAIARTSVSADDAVHYEEVFIPIQRMRRVEVFTPVVAINMSRHREADTIYPGMYGTNVRYRYQGRPSGMRAVLNRTHAIHLELIYKRAGHRPLVSLSRLDYEHRLWLD
jgi:hypothetical protein